MLRLIYRQRRRILFAPFLIALGLFMYASTEPNFFSLPDEASLFHKVFVVGGTYLIFGLVIAAISILWVWLLPNWRFMVEQISMFVFVGMVFETYWPTYHETPVIGSLLPCTVGMLLLMGVYGSTLDRFPIKLGLKATRSFKSRKSQQDLWAELVPAPDHLDTHWDSLLHKIEQDPDAPDTQLVSYHHGTSMFQTQRQKFTEHNAPHNATYAFDGHVSDKNKPITGGTYTVSLDPMGGGGTRVTLTETHDALLLRDGLMMWFDDALGDQTDHLRTLERGKWNWTVTGRYRRKVASLS